MMAAAKRLFALTITHSFTSHRFNRRLSEWHLAGVMLAIGLVVEFGATFGLPPYDVVRQIADERTWSVFMISLGTARLVSLIVNGHAQRITAHARYLLASVSAFTWALLLAGLLAFDTPLMVGPFLASAAIVDLITAFRAAQDARQADETSEAGDGRKSG